MIRSVLLRIAVIFNLFSFLNTTAFSYISFNITNEKGKALFFAIASLIHFHIMLFCGRQIKAESEQTKNK